MNDGRSGVLPARPELRVSLLGYDRGGVERYLEAMDEEIRLLRADRDCAAECVERLAAELAEVKTVDEKLRDRLDRACRSPIEADGLTERLLHMIELAHEEADEITETAKAAAVRSRTATLRSAEQLRARYERRLLALDERRDRLEAEHQDMVRRAQVDIEAMADRAERRRRELDEEAARRRQAAERDFAEAMAARRADVLRQLEQRTAAGER
ncbi:hypothetical protein ABZ863_26505 [Saccharomonospora sp. NPDC046836]|uniref:hypothetical protein n=1 Tax=Saccharomonospora sp. NPDC046836 TaxID=3156921 RepID=UPI0033C213A2